MILIYFLIGNYGINCDDFELIELVVYGLIVKEICDVFLNFRSELLVDEFLK